MIALGITLTWLALTAAGFAALSALGRIELGDDLATDRASREAARARADRHVARDAGSLAAMSPAQTLARRRSGSRVPALRLLPDPGPAHPPAEPHTRRSPCAVQTPTHRRCA